jgi:hypothetical protein
MVERGMHVLFNAVPDIAFALLALAGLAYLLPEPVRRLEKKPKTRILLIAFFTLFGVFAIIVNAVNREAQDNKDEKRSEEISTVKDSVHEIEHDLLHTKAGPETEAERRERITAALRADYIISQDPVDPDILNGTKLPPEKWMNDRLHQLGETWTLSPPALTPAMASARSYLVFDGAPKFAGSSTPNVEGGDYVAGDPIAFNVHFKNRGPNKVELVAAFFATSLEPNVDLQTQKRMMAGHLKNGDEKRALLRAAAGSTLAPGGDLFNTAFVHDGSIATPRWTQQDLDDLHAGTKFVFVIAELVYRDLGAEHHERMCYWLQPPAKPIPGIWQSCAVFTNSD